MTALNEHPILTIALVPICGVLGILGLHYICCWSWLAIGALALVGCGLGVLMVHLFFQNWGIEPELDDEAKL